MRMGVERVPRYGCGTRSTHGPHGVRAGHEAARATVRVRDTVLASDTERRRPPREEGAGVLTLDLYRHPGARGFVGKSWRIETNGATNLKKLKISLPNNNISEGKGHTIICMEIVLSIDSTIQTSQYFFFLERALTRISTIRDQSKLRLVYPRICPSQR